MVDRIAEIREALLSQGWFEPLTTGQKIVMKAAAAYADLLESDALIIRRDENGDWPDRYVAAISFDNWVFTGHRVKPSDVARGILDALADTPAPLASSQGVEP